ncbi:hypothetical protein HPB49_016130 [Dermacentor silvarum]|uniref:Uncharacterized protein n=1 Tax=Dermacentor silvarum TaxID=543639 RepID=A0ACB8E0W8_DERSI|nr:hypothetical protein HPB49_016130 [Dermacentor silvarum]
MANKPDATFAGVPGLQQPSSFDFADPSTWSTWIEQFEDYAYATGLHQATDEVYCMGVQARRVLASFSLSEEEVQSYSIVKSKFTSDFGHPLNEVHESYRFHKRTQQGDESCRKSPTQEEKAASKLESLFNHVQRQFQAKLPVVPSRLQPLHSAIVGSRLAILLRCRRTQCTVCHLVVHLEQINDVIWLLDFEMTEVTPGKHAIGSVGVSEFLKTYQNDMVVDLFAAEAEFDRMLCANIGASDSLTGLRMRRCQLGESASHLLGEALGHLLVLSGEKEVWMHPLAEGVAKAQNLAKIRITDLYINIDYGKSRLDTGRALLGVLEANAAIACLSVDCSLVSLEHGPRFKEWLAQASELTELSLCCSQCNH